LNGKGIQLSDEVKICGVWEYNNVEIPNPTKPSYTNFDLNFNVQNNSILLYLFAFTFSSLDRVGDIIKRLSPDYFLQICNVEINLDMIR